MGALAQIQDSSQSSLQGKGAGHSEFRIFGTLRGRIRRGTLECGTWPMTGARGSTGWGFVPDTVAHDIAPSSLSSLFLFLSS